MFDVLILNRKPKSLVEFLAYHWKNIGDKITRANNNWKGEVFSKKRACATRAENRLYNYNRFWQKKCNHCSSISNVYFLCVLLRLTLERIDSDRRMLDLRRTVLCTEWASTKECYARRKSRGSYWIVFLWKHSFIPFYYSQARRYQTQIYNTSVP